MSRQALADGIAASDSAAAPIGDGYGRRIYWRRWPSHFDYLVWQHFGAPDPAHPEQLEAIARGRHTTIFRIRQPPAAPPARP